MKTNQSILGLREIPLNIIIYLSSNHDPNQKYASQITREFGYTYVHVSKIISKFKEIGLIKEISTKNKRTKYLKLTNKGKILAIHLKELKELLK